MVLGKSVDYWDLGEDERQMVEDYDCRRSANILDALFDEKRKRSLTVTRESCCNDRAEQPAPLLLNWLWPCGVEVAKLRRLQTCTRSLCGQQCCTACGCSVAKPAVSIDMV